MKNRTLRTCGIPILLFAFLQSCASAYHPIIPKKVKHSMYESDKVSKVDLAYKYNVLGEYGNKKYARRAKRGGYQIVACKITNNSADTLIMGKDLVFMNDDKRLIVSNDLCETKIVQQHPLGFLPYAAGSFFAIYLGGSLYKTSESKYYLNGKYFTNKFPLGAVISLPVMLGNMVVSNFSNKAFYDNMRFNDLNGKVILSNESLDGILVFKSKEQILLKTAVIK